MPAMKTTEKEFNIREADLFILIKTKYVKLCFHLDKADTHTLT